jgi:hypothetical protein
MTVSGTSTNNAVNAYFHNLMFGNSEKMEAFVLREYPEMYK